MQKPLGRTLDVGCGFGAGSVQVWRSGATLVHGITNSASQVAVAQEFAEEFGASCYFERRDYDIPLGRRFDSIICVESLAHSVDIKLTMMTLEDQLTRDGQLALLEDMRISHQVSKFDSWLLRKGWHSVGYSVEDYLGALTNAGFCMRIEEDWTHKVALNPRIISYILLTILSFVALLLPPSRIRKIVLFHAAQSLLHLRLKQGQWTYRFMIAEKMSRGVAC